MSLHEVEFSNKKFNVEATTRHEVDFWTLYNSKKWEQVNLQFMIDNVNGDIFVDIGSWIGPVSLLMSRYYDKVIAFDLDPVANEKFKNNLSLNSVANVSLYEVGFSDQAGVLEIDGEDLGKSVTSIYGNGQGKKIKVKIVRLDEFLASLPSQEKIGFIKIDCEGAEYKFLSQVYSFIRGRKIKVLISYHPFVLKKPGYYFTKLRHWLAQLPFERLYFTKEGNIISKKPYHPLFKLIDNFPMADVLIGH